MGRFLSIRHMAVSMVTNTRFDLSQHWGREAEAEFAQTAFMQPSSAPDQFHFYSDGVLLPDLQRTWNFELRACSKQARGLKTNGKKYPSFCANSTPSPAHLPQEQREKAVGICCPVLWCSQNLSKSLDRVKTESNQSLVAYIESCGM